MGPGGGQGLRMNWVRAAVILLFGFLFHKAVCLGCGLAVGRPDAALAAIAGVWLGTDANLNVWELQPFVVLVAVDAAAAQARPAAAPLAIRAGAVAGMLVPLLAVSCHVWLGIFRGQFNGTVLLAFAILPAVAVVGEAIGAGLGWLAAWALTPSPAAAAVGGSHDPPAASARPSE